MKKLSSKAMIGVVLGLTAVGLMIVTSKDDSNTPPSGNDPDPNAGTPSSGGASKPSVNDMLAGASTIAYNLNVIAKGKAYADMQKFLQNSIPEGTSKTYPNYYGIHVLTSANGVNLRLKPSTNAQVFKKVDKDYGVGRVSGTFYKSGGFVWAEMTLIPPFYPPPPLMPIKTVYVALAYLKTLEKINNTVAGLQLNSSVNGFSLLLN